ncbi:UvrD-helicase domain-containing protein [Methanoculleus sp. UBA303]|jgi:hypothetical protein|uniref:UvrD-helicase domain-containing protein n=1 Tax=Methanoculleus sp. UBA303 TaxID=1915497 RepID=UPI0025E84784|nr:UvrD-helicase domain-containing protein [Methanoculleus sp. UBA303]
MTIEITESDIAYAEKLLLPAGQSFDGERRAFIRCVESRDVIACPGSGKTTALLAKILILAKKMPFEDDRGICVLTHTNVAIDEIKQQADHAAADALFRYPNFFGTIQGFVDQFLAMPGYRSEFQKPIVAIDNDRFFSELERLYSKDYKLRGWMEHKGGISTLGNYWLHPKTLKVGKSLDEPISKLGEDTSTYQRINGIRKEVLERGFLSYNDAYSIALRYLNFVPAIRQAFQDRFCMVFLDEAQDTYEHQFRVLDTLFQPDKLVLQRIGDPNQAIFGPTTGSNMVWSPKSPLHFSDTQRYGDTISRILSSVRLQDDISLRACQSRNSYPPQIIAFLPGEEHQVIRAFVELIHSFELSEDTYYAIGWVGKDNTAKEKLCIPTYFPQFTGFQKSSSKQFSNLISYTAYAIQIAKLECVKCFSEIILQGIAHALNDAGIKTEESNRSYTSHTVKIHWKCQDEEGYNEFRSQIACSYLQALGSHLDAIEFRDSIKAALTSIWPINGEKATFLICDMIDFANQPDTKEPINQFISDSGIIVNVGTVHSVKGETHAATLYLETDYYGQTDAKRLINFLKGKRNPSELGKERHKENLKIAHVAFSRPKYLLAFACQTSSVAGHKKELKDNGWEIRSVPGLIMGREEIA